MKKVRRRAVETEVYNEFCEREIKVKVILKQPGEDSHGNYRINRLLRRFVSSSGVHCTGRD